MLRTRLFPVLCLLLTACGTSDDAGGGGPIPVEETGAAVAEVMCDRLANCCDLTDFAQAGITDRASCETALTGLFSSSQDEFQDAVARGTMAYDGAAAAACLRSLQRGDCTTGVFDGAEECDQVWQGRVANGAECRFDEECRSGICSFPDEQATTGLCAVPTVGGPCARTCFTDDDDGERFCFNTCGEGLVCSTTFEGDGTPVSLCVQNTVVGEGEECSVGDVECADGFWCDYEANACKPVLPDGSTCESSWECASDTCNGGVCEAASVCNSFF